MALKQYFSPDRVVGNSINKQLWANEANAWATLYMMFNNCSEQSMRRGFDLEEISKLTLNELHQTNVDLIGVMGVDTFKEYNTHPELNTYLTEYENCQKVRAADAILPDNPLEDDVEMPFV